ncbi:MAG: RNA pyrophosphohydrolase [Methyloligellaceae bacterium]
MTNREELPYRRCAGIALLNEDGRVWVGKRTPRKWDATSSFLWQMPQGGVDQGEDPYEAAKRELYEETGINNAELICEIDEWLTYEIPDELLGVALKGKYRGQIQKWYIMRFTGQDQDVNLSPPGHSPEFDSWRWAEIDELPELIIPFKQNVYRQIVLELKKIASSETSVERSRLSNILRFFHRLFKRKQSGSRAD